MRRGVALGAAGYLTKPIDRDRLHRLIAPFPRAVAADPGPAGGGRPRSQRDRVRGWLEGQNWIVQEAENGREALARLQQVSIRT